MALLKNLKTTNGLDINYHKIIRNEINWLTREATVVLYMYANKVQREAYPLNPMDTRVLNWKGVDFIFTVDGNNVEQAYVKVVESKPEIVIITPAVPAVYDEEGNLITPEIPAVTETIETNEFFGSEEI